MNYTNLGDQDGCETHCLPQQRLVQGAGAGPILHHPALRIILHFDLQSLRKGPSQRVKCRSIITLL